MAEQRGVSGRVAGELQVVRSSFCAIVDATSIPCLPRGRLATAVRGHLPRYHSTPARGVAPRGGCVWPAMMTSSPSTRIGLRKPNSWMLPATFAIAASGQTRALRGYGEPLDGPLLDAQLGRAHDLIRPATAGANCCEFAAGCADADDAHQAALVEPRHGSLDGVVVLLQRVAAERAIEVHGRSAGTPQQHQDVFLEVGGRAAGWKPSRGWESQSAVAEGVIDASPRRRRRSASSRGAGGCACGRT